MSSICGIVGALYTLAIHLSIFALNSASAPDVLGWQADWKWWENSAQIAAPPYLPLSTMATFLLLEQNFLCQASMIKLWNIKLFLNCLLLLRLAHLFCTRDVRTEDRIVFCAQKSKRCILQHLHYYGFPYKLFLHFHRCIFVPHFPRAASFSTLQFCAAFSCPGFSTPTLLCRIFMSRIFSRTDQN